MGIASCILYVFWFFGLYGELELPWISCYCIVLYGNQLLLLLLFFLTIFSEDWLLKKNSTACIIFFIPERGVMLRRRSVWV